MGNTPDYYTLLSKLDLPHPKKESRPLLPLTMAAMSAHSRGFKEALHWLSQQAAGGRSGEDAAAVRDAMRLILMNLVDAMFSRCWIAIPAKQTAYNPGTYLHDKLHLRARSVAACMKVLKNTAPAPLVYKQMGYVDFFGGSNQCNKYFPTPDLQHKIWNAYVAVEQPIRPPYVEFRDHDAAWEPSQDDINRLTKINDFLSEHTWAGKGPVVLKYSQNPFRGGRVYTRFSQLPMRRIPLRINTLIDEKPICEVDYVSNHPRMALVLAGYVPPDDVYAHIASLLPLPIERETVKAYFQCALGASDKEKAFNASKRSRINRSLFNQLTDITLNNYPKMGPYLFNDAGAKLQSIEGSMAIEIMESGMEENIPVLPIHDSFAVPIEYEAWLVKTMERVWETTFRHLTSCTVAPKLKASYSSGLGL
jgi:hypothetical protein